MASDDLHELIQDDPFHVVIRKTALDVFENPNTDKLLDLIEPQKVVVFGVALDFCVACVLEGLARHPNVELALLRDATKGLGTKPEEDIFDEWRRRGVEVTTLEACMRRLPCG